jgi:hypothetical protein
MWLGRHNNIGTSRIAINRKGTALDLANSVPGQTLAENTNATRMSAPSRHHVTARFRSGL